MSVTEQGVEGASGPSRFQGRGKRGQGLSLKLGTRRAQGAAGKVCSDPVNRKDCCAGAEGREVVTLVHSSCSLPCYVSSSSCIPEGRSFLNLPRPVWSQRN